MWRLGVHSWNLLDVATTMDSDLFRTVPLSTKDDKKATIFDYSARGMQDFFPWFVSEKNSARHTDVIRNLIDFLPFFRILIEERHQYPFLRCDINIFLTLMKVHLHDVALLYF